MNFNTWLALALASLLSAVNCGWGGIQQTPPPPATCTTIPAVPANLGSSGVTASNVTLSWSAVTTPNCSVSYVVYQDGETAISGLTGTSTTITGLTPSTTYTFTVASTDAAGASAQSGPLPVTTNSSGSIGVTSNGITVTGKLIWHSYTNYGFSGVQSWMINFDTGNIYEITPTRVSAAMNYDFNQDGTVVVVMGSDNNASVQAWDIWVANVTDSGLANVTKLTSASTDGSRNEDPKFSSDGSKIIFKKNLDNIVSLNTSDFTLNGVDQTPPQTVLLANSYESSMPYYLVGSDANFVFTDDSDPTYSTIQYDNGGTVSTLYAPPGLHAYYPIALNSTQFYYAQSDSANHDQIYLGDISGDTPVAAAFNIPSYEFADPYPMNAEWVAYTSTQSGGSGTYDIWIGSFVTGETYNLNSWIAGSNHSNSDLGPTFYGTISSSKVR